MRILKQGAEVHVYLPKIRELADSHTDALGFLPASAFQELAARNRLWVAVSDDSLEPMGFLLFGGRFPGLRIQQLFVQPEYRRQGVAAALVAELVQFGEARNYLSISARVASDLLANRFWEKVGFRLLRQEPGGKTTRRTVNIRVRELDSPSLLRFGVQGRDAPSTKAQDLSFRWKAAPQNPLYVLDLNVFFDVVHDRVQRREAACILRAGLNHQLRLCVTPEFAEELRRHSAIGRSDPVREFALELPTLPRVNRSNLEGIVAELRNVIFPGRPSSKRQDAHKESDLLHLAYCIHHRVAGFITRDNDILRAGQELEQGYSIEILSPADLVGTNDRLSFPLIIRALSEVGNFSVHTASEAERGEVEAFLERLGVIPSTIQVAWNAGATGFVRHRLVARLGGRLIGVASWDNPTQLRRVTSLYALLDEECPKARDAIEYILDVAIKNCMAREGRLIELHATAEQAITRLLASERGFVRGSYAPHASDQPGLVKFCHWGFIGKDTWQDFVDLFLQLTGLQLPPQLPTFDELTNTGMSICSAGGKLLAILPLYDFESLISPGIVLCRGRSGLVVPIQHQFADELFHSIPAQLPIFPLPEAALHIEKTYFRYPSRKNIFVRGSPLLFYVSGRAKGSKEIIGYARLVSSEIFPLDRIPGGLKARGVLTSKELKGYADASGRIHAFTFDTFTPFPRTIPYSYLRRQGLISRANLVTAEPLDSGRLARLYSYAFKETPVDD